MHSLFPPDSQAEELDALDKMKAVQLKTLCKERGLKVSGKKAELQERLRAHFLASSQPTSSEAQTSLDDFEAMSDDDLRDALVVRGIKSTGTRKQLLARLKKDIDWANEVTSTVREGDDGYVALSEALELAAKNEGGAILEYLNDLKEKSEEVPKFVDVTISSLGLHPEKYTAGGAPSVTADVIRKLAGDPFADPPKYGSVSVWHDTRFVNLLSFHCANVLFPLPGV